MVSGALGGDLHLAAAGGAVAGGVGVLIDGDGFDGRGRNAEGGLFDAVNDQRGAGLAGDAGVEEGGERADDIVIEDGQGLDIAGGDGGTVSILVGGEGICVLRRVYVDAGGDAGQIHGESEGGKRCCGDADGVGERLKAGKLDGEAVVSGGGLGDAELACAVGYGVGDYSPVGALQLDLRAGDDGSGGVLQVAAKGGVACG